MSDCTIGQVLLTPRKLKCMSFDHQIIPAELTKQQRIIFEQAEVLVPKSLGI